MLQDFQYAMRNLRRTPLFTIVALFSLALGIGANSAVFTIADQILLRPIPVTHARQLVSFTSPGPQSGIVWGENRFSYPMFRDFRDHNTVFEGVAARFTTALNLSYNNRSERIPAELVSGTWFDTLGLATFLGRGITADDDLRSRRPSRRRPHVRLLEIALQRQSRHSQSDRAAQRPPHDRDRRRRARISRLRPRRAHRRPGSHHDEGRR